MDLRVKIQPKEIFIYSMYNFWAGMRGIGSIILTVLVIIAAAASEELLPMDDIEAEDGEVYLYRYSEDVNGQPNLENIEDDDEYEIVADAFDELLDEQEYDELVGEDELDQ